jgi:glycosyltransferase involved in cell wall biosynthesis
MHNLASHEQFHPRLEKFFLKWLSSQVDMSIHMSKSGQDAAFQRYPALKRRRSAVIPLMHFGETYGELPTLVNGRNELGLAADLRVVLMLGQIRRYKNAPELIKAFSALPDQDLRLFVVGKPLNDALEGEIRKVVSDPRITLSLQVASIDAVKTYMAAASLVVAPYSEVMNSGSALLSLTHNRPVLLPNRGAIGELQSVVGASWVQTYEPPLTPEKLSGALKWASLSRSSMPNLSQFSPDWVVERHNVALSDLMRRMD